MMNPNQWVSKECNIDGCSNTTNQYTRKDGSKVVSSRCNVCNNNMRLYKITTPQREELLKSQGYLCKCCSNPIKFSGERYKSACRDNAVVDHCHETGEIRGILCGNCNLVVGRLDDSLQYLYKVQRYMEGF